MLVWVRSPWWECHPMPSSSPLYFKGRPELNAAVSAYPWRAHVQHLAIMPRVVGRWPCAVRAVSRVWRTWWMVERGWPSASSSVAAW